MSIRLIGRGYGCAITCNMCGAKLQTANIKTKINRAYAASLGWGRGRVRCDKKAGIQRTAAHDFCPTCLPIDHAAAKRQTDERNKRIAEKNAKRKAQWAPQVSP